jgi:hypothetical protein
MRHVEWQNRVWLGISCHTVFLRAASVAAALTATTFAAQASQGPGVTAGGASTAATILAGLPIAALAIVVAFGLVRLVLHRKDGSLPPA